MKKLKCTSCGASINPSSGVCDYCGSRFIITCEDAETTTPTLDEKSIREILTSAYSTKFYKSVITIVCILCVVWLFFNGFGLVIMQSVFSVIPTIAGIAIFVIVLKSINNSSIKPYNTFTELCQNGSLDDAYTLASSSNKFEVAKLLLEFYYLKNIEAAKQTILTVKKYGIPFYKAASALEPIYHYFNMEFPNIKALINNNQ